MSYSTSLPIHKFIQLPIRTYNCLALTTYQLSLFRSPTTLFVVTYFLHNPEYMQFNPLGVIYNKPLPRFLPNWASGSSKTQIEGNLRRQCKINPPALPTDWGWPPCPLASLQVIWNCAWRKQNMKSKNVDLNVLFFFPQSIHTLLQNFLYLIPSKKV